MELVREPQSLLHGRRILKCALLVENEFVRNCCFGPKCAQIMTYSFVFTPFPMNSYDSHGSKDSMGGAYRSSRSNLDCQVQNSSTTPSDSGAFQTINQTHPVQEAMGPSHHQFHYGPVNWDGVPSRFRRSARAALALQVENRTPPILHWKRQCKPVSLSISPP